MLKKFLLLVVTLVAEASCGNALEEYYENDLSEKLRQVMTRVSPVVRTNFVYDGTFHVGVSFDRDVFTNVVSEYNVSFSIEGTICSANAGKYETIFIASTMGGWYGQEWVYIGRLSEFSWTDEQVGLLGDDYDIRYYEYENDGDVYHLEYHESNRYYYVTTNFTWQIVPREIREEIVVFPNVTRYDKDTVDAGLSFVDVPPTVVTTKDYHTSAFRESYLGRLTYTVFGCGNYTGAVTRVYSFKPASRATAVVFR